MIAFFKKVLLSKSVLKNIVANYGASFSATILSFAFTPVYIYYLGIEAYGIIGFFVSITVFLNFLNLGIGPVVNREMAKFHNDASQLPYVNRLIFTLQAVYVSVGLLIAFVMMGLAPVLATKWFNPDHISDHVAAYAFVILAATIGVRWPNSFYSSALRGMHLQVLLNANEMFWNILKTVGSWLVLKYFSFSLIGFLWFQCIVIAAQTVTIYFLTWRFIPQSHGNRLFDKKLLRSLAKYTAAMGFGAILVAVIFQIDKIILGKTLKATDYGYYILANNVSVLVYSVSMPLGMALFPHFTSHVHKQETGLLEADFHKYTRILSITLLPAFFLLIFFTPELLWIWTHNSEIIKHTAPLIRIMLLGTVLHAFMAVPHVLLLAFNKTRFIIRSHLIAIVFMLPVVFLLSTYFGSTGGAISYAFVFGGYFILQAPFILKSCVPGNSLSWYWGDIFRIALPLLVLSGAIRFGVSGSYFTNQYVSLAILAFTFLLMVVLAIKLSGLNILKMLIPRTGSLSGSSAVSK